MGQARGHEQLGSVGDDALDEAGEGVKNTGGLARVELILLADVAGQGAGGEDGDGVVGRAEVGQTHQGGYAQFGTSLA